MKTAFLKALALIMSRDAELLNILSVTAKMSLRSSVIARLPVGSEITVTEHGTDWCKVIVDGVEGYVSTWFMRF